MREVSSSFGILSCLSLAFIDIIVGGLQVGQSQLNSSSTAMIKVPLCALVVFLTTQVLASPAQTPLRDIVSENETATSAGKFMFGHNVAISRITFVL